MGKFEIKQSMNGKYYFNLKAGNGQIILSSDMYEFQLGAENGILSVQKNAGADDHYDRKLSTNGKPYFTLKAGNGQPIGKSEMYESSAAMENGIESVKRNAPGADIYDLTGTTRPINKEHKMEEAEVLTSSLVNEKLAAQIENNFQYHSPKDDQPGRYEALRAKAKELAQLMNASCPDSREKSLAITHLEDAVMWANASIARNE